ncbi:MAG: glycosyltransferase [Candidatus Hodarchaeota archaeon]
MKIAMVHPYLNYLGGAERILANMVNILAEEHEIELFSFAFSGTFLSKLKKKVTLRKIPNFSLLDGTSLPPFNRWTIRAYINTFLMRRVYSDAEIITYHNVPAFWMVSGPGKKIWMCQEPQRAFYDPTIILKEKIPWFLVPLFQITARYLVSKDRKVAEMMDIILVNSEISRKLIFQVYKKKSTVLRLPVTLERKPNSLKVSRIRSKYCHPDGRLIIIVGGVEPTKGAISAIEALTPFLRKGEVSLVLEGNHAFSSKIKSKVQKLGLNEHVFLPGRIPNIVDLYEAADFILVNSGFEPFGLAAAEGMSLGSIPLVSKKAGVSEIIENGLNGFCFSNLNELQNILQSLINEQYNLEKIRKRAQETIKVKCSLENFRAQVKNLFTSI